MDKPKRIQRRRSKGWKMPPNTVIVSRPTKWGNPFLVHPKQKPGRLWACGLYQSVPTAEDAVECYRLMMESPGETAEALRRALPELRGRNLACFCKIGAPCHADVLLELANPPTSDGGR
jgi:hypothetical protein